MAVERCPQCHRIVSSRLDYCSCCGLSRDAFDTAKKNRSERVNSAKATVKKFVLAGIAILLIVCIGAAISYAGQPLHGDDKIAYDLISSSSFFRGATKITVRSGDVFTNSINGEHRAYLTISYVKGETAKIGHYAIKENSVTDIGAELEKRKSGDPDYLTYLREMEISEFDNKLDYEAISVELNK